MRPVCRPRQATAPRRHHSENMLETGGGEGTTETTVIHPVNGTAGKPMTKSQKALLTRNTGRPASYRLLAFAYEDLKDGNATRAAKRVGYSAKTAHSQGPRLLANVEVQRIIAQKLKDAGATAERVLLEVQRIATVDLSDLFTPEGNLKPFEIWTPAQRAALASFEVKVVKKNAAGADRETDIILRVKFWNKIQALELLMKHHGLLQGELEPEVRVPCFIMPEGTKVAIE